MAYSDDNFGLTMKGMDDGGSKHYYLMMQLSKKVRVVMTDEYRTTKACPVCKDYWINWEKQSENGLIIMLIILKMRKRKSDGNYDAFSNKRAKERIQCNV